MIASDSDRAAQMRADTWRRRHDRRYAGAGTTLMTVVRPPAQLADLLVSLSRGSIGVAAARAILGIAKGDATVEIVIDPETGRVERWTMTTGVVAWDGSATAEPTTMTPAA